MEIRDCFGKNLPGFGLERTRDALAQYAALRWPSARRKSVGVEWGLNEDEARSVCSGRASWQTFDKIIQHPNGGWPVLFAVFGALLDETADQFINNERRRHGERAQTLRTVARDLRSFAPVPDRRASDAGVQPSRRRGAGGH